MQVRRIYVDSRDKQYDSEKTAAFSVRLDDGVRNVRQFMLSDATIPWTEPNVNHRNHKLHITTVDKGYNGKKYPMDDFASVIGSQGLQFSVFFIDIDNFALKRALDTGDNPLSHVPSGQQRTYTVVPNAQDAVAYQWDSHDNKLPNSDSVPTLNSMYASIVQAAAATAIKFFVPNSSGGLEGDSPNVDGANVLFNVDVSGDPTAVLKAYTQSPTKQFVIPRSNGVYFHKTPLADALGMSGKFLAHLYLDNHSFHHSEFEATTIFTPYPLRVQQTVEIPSKNYTGTELAAAVQSSLRSFSFWSYKYSDYTKRTYTPTVTYDKDHNTFTLKWPDIWEHQQIDLDVIGSKSNSLAYMMGFRNSSELSSTTTSVTSELANLSGENYVYLRSDLGTDDSILTNPHNLNRDIIAKIPVTVPYGNVMFWHNAENNLIGNSKDVLEQISFRLVDYYGNELELDQNSPVSFTILCFYA